MTFVYHLIKESILLQEESIVYMFIIGSCRVKLYLKACATREGSTDPPARRPIRDVPLRIKPCESVSEKQDSTQTVQMFRLNLVMAGCVGCKLSFHVQYCKMMDRSRPFD